MLKQSRLSVSAVKPKEWAFILGLAGEEDEIEGKQDDDEQAGEGEGADEEDASDEAAEGDVDGVDGEKEGSSVRNELVDDEAGVDGDTDDDEDDDDADDKGMNSNGEEGE